MAQTQAVKTHSSKMQHRVMMIIIYVLLIVVAFLMLIPFVWMLSASFKLNKDVFVFPIQWIPTNPRWQNYVDIWTRIPLLTFVLNTAKLTVIVTLLQLFTSSFAAYAFAKMQFRGKNALFLGYIATIAVPWQAYMVPQFMMMRSWGLNNTHLAIICLQAFSAFGVFLMNSSMRASPPNCVKPPASTACRNTASGRASCCRFPSRQSPPSSFSPSFPPGTTSWVP